MASFLCLVLRSNSHSFCVNVECVLPVVVLFDSEEAMPLWSASILSRFDSPSLHQRLTVFAILSLNSGMVECRRERLPNCDRQ